MRDSGCVLLKAVKWVVANQDARWDRKCGDVIYAAGTRHVRIRVRAMHKTVQSRKGPSAGRVSQVESEPADSARPASRRADSSTSSLQVRQVMAAERLGLGPTPRLAAGRASRRAQRPGVRRRRTRLSPGPENPTVPHHTRAHVPCRRLAVSLGSLLVPVCAGPSPAQSGLLPCGRVGPLEDRG